MMIMRSALMPNGCDLVLGVLFQDRYVSKTAGVDTLSDVT